MNYFNKFHKDIITSILDKIINIYNDNLVSLIIFGSYARNTAKLSSDLDILIIVNKKNKKSFFYNKIEKAFEKDLQKLFENYAINLDLSPFIISKENSYYFNPIYLDMINQSEIIIDKDNHFANILKKLEKIKQKHSIKKEYIGNTYLWNFIGKNLIGEKI